MSKILLTLLSIIPYAISIIGFFIFRIVLSIAVIAFWVAYFVVVRPVCFVAMVIETIGEFFIDHGLGYVIGLFFVPFNLLNNLTAKIFGLEGRCPIYEKYETTKIPLEIEQAIIADSFKYRK